MDFNNLLSEVKGIGPKRAELLGRLGLFTLRDLLYYAPRDYLDLREPTSVSELKHGDYGLIRITDIGSPTIARIQIHGRNVAVVNVRIEDGTGSCRATWFDQSYRVKQIPKFATGYIHGKISRSNGVSIVNGAFCASPPGIIPIYSLTRGISQTGLRTCIKSAFRSVGGIYGETLPECVRLRNDLCQLGFALENLHFPTSPDSLSIAKKRLAFEDMLYFTVLLDTIRDRRRMSSSPAFEVDGAIPLFTKMLPFSPTDGQLKIMDEISADISKTIPMNRLVQGDVGSGKTILAIFAMYCAVKNGYQSALMVPTELLAEQHYKQLQKFFGSCCVLLKGSMRKAERDAALASIRDGTALAVIGTHALISNGVQFKNLGLVVTDEQHRFGVRQRAHLGSKAESPHVLIMSATPIPRTLSLILYGDLDVSRLSELPKGRIPVATRYVAPEKRMDMYQYIERRISADSIQAFVVCPMIEDSEDIENVFSAEKVYSELCEKLNLRIALLHGKMKAVIRDEIMECFRRGEIDLLVSTTVIEVGVDVPNACVMVIESAERFGLAQLHQLRGRVGRGNRESFCFLLSESRSASSLERIKTLISTNDGFVVAEKDLEMRGPGEFLGQKQCGLSEFAAAKLLSNMDTLYNARSEATRLLSEDSADSNMVINAANRIYGRIKGDIAIN